LIAKVTKCEDAKGKESGNPYLKVTLEGEGQTVDVNVMDYKGDGKMAFFRNAFNHGLFVNVETKQNGKYTNITKWLMVKDAVPTEPPQLVDTLKTMRASAEGKIKPSIEDNTSVSNVLDKYNQNEERTRSITLSYAVTLVANGRIKPDDLYTKADEMARYVVNGKIEVDLPF